MTSLQRLAGGAATAFAALMLAAPAYAGGSIKDKPEPRRCTLAANVALTTDYVFRGISQTAEAPAIQGGFDATCGIFYAGVWASSLDLDLAGLASIEMDWYVGIKPVTGKITWDLGVIYYSYPNAKDLSTAELNMVELKVGASGEVWKGGTLGVTVFYSPDYTTELGPVWTVETAFAQALPKVGMFTPTFSALIGYQAGDDATYSAAYGDSSYLYWNAGLTFGFADKFSIDFRYWDTDLASGTASCGTAVLQCDERYVATLKFTY